jgi:hypothetical protein
MRYGFFLLTPTFYYWTNNNSRYLSFVLQRYWGYRLAGLYNSSVMLQNFHFLDSNL